MGRWHWILCLCAVVWTGRHASASAQTSEAASESATQPSAPNILFILTDDQGWTTPSCYGNHLVDTPHLDRLAAEGMRFTDAYVTPQCTPTRASLLTGQHTARNGMWHVRAGCSAP